MTPSYPLNSQALARRRLLQIAGGVATAAGVGMLEACSAFSTNPSSSDTSRASAPASGGAGTATTAKESPMLAEQVAAGKLPPLEQRIPANPAVLKPYDGPGLYGGTARSLWPSEEARETPTHSGRWAEFNPVDGSVVPTMLEGWDISADSKTFTFHLRKGLKWSDGQPYTTDDVMFAMKNVLENSTLTPAFPSAWSSGGKAPTVSAVDETTFTLAYEVPAGLLMTYIAFQGHSLLLPKHYLSQFHPDFAAEAALTKAAKAAGFETWDQYFQNRNDFWTNTELPVINPWMVTHPMTTANGRAILTRNPYYYKTDDQGRQLPYIDKWTYTLTSADTALLKVANGEFDVQVNSLTMTVSDLGLLADNADKGHYTVNKWPLDAGFLVLYCNQYHKTDPVLRKLLQNIDFRQALSVAINRDEMNQALYNGQGSTNQPTSLPQDKFYVEGTGKRFTEYDPDKAGQLLDSLGLTKGSDGIRTRPDGKPLELLIETFEYQDAVAKASDAYEYVVRYWNAIGIKANLKLYDVTAWIQKTQSGDYAISGYEIVGYLWEVDTGEGPVPDGPDNYWAPMFGLWHATGGKQGPEPTPEIKKLLAAYDALKTQPDAEKAKVHGQEVVKLNDENVWVIGTVTFPWRPMIANADLMNLRKDALSGWSIGHEQATKIEQLAYTNPEAHT